MKKVKKKTVRIWGKLSEEKAKVVKDRADFLGLSLMSFVGICTWIGAMSITKTLDLLDEEKDGVTE